jgi:3-hydroxyisobutyrate dehydrogenase-like beta-hydroxyacid dehydrogenase
VTHAPCVCADYTETLAQDRFEPTPEKPGFRLDGGYKDGRLMRALATDLNVPLPLCDLFLGHMQPVRNNGGGHLDWASLALAVRKDAGLPVKPDVYS